MRPLAVAEVREANSAKFLAADAGFFAADRAVDTTVDSALPASTTWSGTSARHA